MEPKALQRIADLRRADAVTMIHTAKTGHTGGSMSCLDILTVLYYDVMNVDPKDPKKPDRDRFFLSKGHSVEGYWAILGDLGFFPKAWLSTFSKPDSPLIGHRWAQSARGDFFAPTA
jgi:transketolase